MPNIEKEMKAAQHLLYVSMKYTKTCDVMLNLMQRWQQMIDEAMISVLERAKKKKTIKDIPIAPIQKMNAMKDLFKKEELIQEMLMDVYEQFVEAVAESRKMPIEEVKKYADGRIFSGRQALEYGFIDALGTQNDAVERAADIAGIKGKPRVIRKTRRSFPFGQFAEEMLRQYRPAVQPDYAPVLYLLR